ncbi:MAG: hypothetical protein ACJ8F1_25895 [Polyangia bacterium]
MPRRVALAACLALFSTAAARAETAAPLVHPIFAHLPDAPEDDRARQDFTTAATHYNLRPVEVVDVPAPPAPRGPDDARMGILNAQKMAFTEAKKDLDAAATEAAATGGAGFSTADLVDLYLNRAMATARSDWKAQAAAPPTDERTRAFDDYLRAATLMPDRAANARQLPPQALADLQRALDIVHKRARGTLVVKGPADALIALDGGALQPLGGGATFKDLVFGEHLLRVEQIGFTPWGTAIPFGQPEMEVDVPARAPLGLDPVTAAAHARRMGARYALVATPKGGPGAPVELSLIDSATAVPRDASMVATARERGQMDAAVMRLDEEARRLTLEQQQNGGGAVPVVPVPAADGAAMGPPLLLTPAGQKSHFREDPAAWARDRWPLLTAVGAFALTAIVLSAVVASDR